LAQRDSSAYAERKLVLQREVFRGGGADGNPGPPPRSAKSQGRISAQRSERPDDGDPRAGVKKTGRP